MAESTGVFAVFCEPFGFESVRMGKVFLVEVD